jgi:hypothetical protein
MRNDLERRLEALETGAHRGQTPTTDEFGNQVWIKDSGLSLLRKITQASRELGRAAWLQDLSEDDRRLAKLWSRADPNRCGLASMVVGTCRGRIHEV